MKPGLLRNFALRDRDEARHPRLRREQVVNRWIGQPRFTSQPMDNTLRRRFQRKPKSIALQCDRIHPRSREGHSSRPSLRLPIVQPCFHSSAALGQFVCPECFRPVPALPRLRFDVFDARVETVFRRRFGSQCERALFQAPQETARLPLSTVETKRGSRHRTVSVQYQLRT